MRIVINDVKNNNDELITDIVIDENQYTFILKIEKSTINGISTPNELFDIISREPAILRPFNNTIWNIYKNECNVDFPIEIEE